jgi:acetolactate synthase-1/2/3 large subunit
MDGVKSAEIRAMHHDSASSSRSGGRLLVDGLLRHGIDHVFTVPGESFLPVLEALRVEQERIRLVVCRHEGGAAYAAEAFGKLTGRPAACLVTRGPGATNAAIGVHAAMQASTPVLLLVGQVARRLRGTRAFQEVDIEAMFAPLAKHVYEVHSASDVTGAFDVAFAAATSHPFGPAVLAFPQDVLEEEVL